MRTSYIAVKTGRIMPAGAEEIERFAVGPIPARAFHLKRYVSEAEKAKLIKGGATEDEFKRGSLSDPSDQTVIQYGEWLTDTFKPMLLLNEDQLLDIGEHAPEDMEQWEKDGWVIAPHDSQWMVRK